MALEIPGGETSSFRAVDGLFTIVIILGGWLWSGLLGYVREMKQELIRGTTKVECDLRQEISKVEETLRSEVKGVQDLQGRDRSALFDALDQLRRYLDGHARRSEERHLEVIKALANKAELSR